MTRKKAAAAKGSGKREAIDNRAGEFYGRRNASGQFKEMDERGKSLARDRRQKARLQCSLAKAIEATRTAE
jgi:hypothetical protein